MVVISRRVRSPLRILLTFSLRCKKPSVHAQCVGVYRLYSRRTAVIAVARLLYFVNGAKTVRTLQGRLFKYIIRALHCVYIIMCTLHVYYILYTRVYYNNADAETKRETERVTERERGKE